LFELLHASIFFEILASRWESIVALYIGDTNENMLKYLEEIVQLQ
jgi:hypothetical protein